MLADLDHRHYIRIARTGLEPVLSALRGRRVNQLHQRALNYLNECISRHLDCFQANESYKNCQAAFLKPPQYSTGAL
jgi:hypothetical protein